MSQQLTLPGMPEPTAPVSHGKVSADAARTARQRAGIPYGAHPLTVSLDGPLRIHPQAADQNRTCGNCRFREIVNLGTQRSYPKCLAERPPYAQTRDLKAPSRVSHGAGTDIRKWWPGCRDHEFGDNDLSPDAARSGPADAYRTR